MKSEALPEWKQPRIEPTPPKSYAVANNGNPLGYIWANDLDEALKLAALRWRDVSEFQAHLWEGVF